MVARSAHTQGVTYVNFTRSSLLLISTLVFSSWAFPWATQAASVGFLGAKKSEIRPQFLVKMRSPQDVQSIRHLKGLKSGVFSQAQTTLVNAEEGVLRMRFDADDTAENAREFLVRSGLAESVVPNLWYQPLLHFDGVGVDVETTPEPSSLFSLYHFPQPRRASVPAPGVLWPVPAQQAGVDPYVSKDWALARVRLDDALSFLGQAPQQLVTAVIDTGVDYNHEDLVGAMWRSPWNPREVGYDFIHGSPAPYDKVRFDLAGCFADTVCGGCMRGDQEYQCVPGMSEEECARRADACNGSTHEYMQNPGHGTHCAGHVGAVADNSLGIRGIGAQSRMMGLKFFYDYGEEGAGGGDDAAAIKSIDYAVKNGARVISASWGGRSTREKSAQSLLKASLLRARAAGVLVVIAAGNDGIDQESDTHPVFPAAYGDELDNLIVVAATDKSDGLANFSNYGVKSVHLGAPGVRILSTTVGSKYSDLVATYKDEQGRTRGMPWNGTSMATPIVAGAVALVWAKYPDENYLEIKKRILSSVKVVPGLKGKVITGGMLDVAAAMK